MRVVTYIVLCSGYTVVDPRNVPDRVLAADDAPYRTRKVTGPAPVDGMPDRQVPYSPSDLVLPQLQRLLSGLSGRTFGRPGLAAAWA
jgi:hypothetical protein